MFFFFFLARERNSRERWLFNCFFFIQVGLALTTAGGDVEVGVVACGNDVGLLDDGEVVGIYRTLGESVVTECPIAHSNVFA